ncbi:coenzyme F420 hydrogenase/dehydrogenase beta subunit N-terminal domain-containing protein [Aeromicrobium sp. UC242_57]
MLDTTPGCTQGTWPKGSFRANGSSGGFVTWILSELLTQGKIDGVVHVGEQWGEDGILFRYEISRTIAEINARSKSRYYPAELSAALGEILESPGRYAVVGIPSVVSEVRLLAENHATFGERIAFAIGLICGHQKSTKYVESFAWQCGIKPGDLRDFDFRKKKQRSCLGLRDGDDRTCRRGGCDSPAGPKRTVRKQLGARLLQSEVLRLHR